MKFSFYFVMLLFRHIAAFSKDELMNWYLLLSVFRWFGKFTV